MGDGVILAHVDVQPVLFEVLGDYLARLDDATFLGEIFLAEELDQKVSACDSREA